MSVETQSPPPVWREIGDVKVDVSDAGIRALLLEAALMVPASLMRRCEPTVVSDPAIRRTVDAHVPFHNERVRIVESRLRALATHFDPRGEPCAICASYEHSTKHCDAEGMNS